VPLCLNWSVAFRLNNFVVGLTNDDPTTTPPVFMSSYTLCAQYDGSVAAGASVTVTCAPSAETFRYVIIQGSITEAICLLEVEVYGSSKWQSKRSAFNTPINAGIIRIGAGSDYSAKKIFCYQGDDRGICI